MQNLMLNKLISILSSIQFNFQRQEQGAHTAYRGKLFWKKTTYLCTAAHLMFAYSHLRNMETKKKSKKPNCRGRWQPWLQLQKVITYVTTVPFPISSSNTQTPVP